MKVGTKYHGQHVALHILVDVELLAENIWFG